MPQWKNLYNIYTVYVASSPDNNNVTQNQARLLLVKIQCTSKMFPQLRR